MTMTMSNSNNIMCEDTPSPFLEYISQMNHFCFQIHNQTIFSASMQVTGVSNGVNNNIRKVKDSLAAPAIKEVTEIVNLLLSKRFSQEPFYFVFNDVSSKRKENNNNGDDEESRKSRSNYSGDLTYSTIGDVSVMRKDRSTDSRSSSESESMFGSPLKLQAIADLDLSAINKHLTSTPSKSKHCDGISLQGLSLQQARNVLKKFCLVSRNNKKDSSILETIIILCNASDSKNTLLLGARNEDNTVLRTFCTTMTSFNQRVKLSSFQPLNHSKATEYQMSGDYEMLDKRESVGLMLLKAQWADQLGLPRISNLHNAKFFLKLSTASGCPDSPIYPYFQQLEEVRQLFKALKNGDMPSIKKTTDNDAMQTLQQLFTRIKKGEESGLMSMNCDHGKKINLAPQRDSDFTDEIWTVMQQCTSYDEMLKCLQTTLSTLKSRVISVYVHKENQTIMAQLVRQCSLGMASFPPLIGGLPLKMIVEIGLEKIKRDYCAVLIESGLCSSQDLNNFIKECQRDAQDGDNSYDVENVKESQMEVTRKLHHCLELACLADSYSEHLNLNSLVSVVLNQYKTQDLNEQEVFTVSLMPEQAFLQIKNVSPCILRRECITDNECYIDCYISELPDTLRFPSSCLPTDTGDISNSVLTESKEFYAFHTKENMKLLPPSS